MHIKAATAADIRQRSRKFGGRERFAAALALLLACLAAAPGQSGNASVLGAYKITFGGALTGKGNAAVNPNSVIVTATVRDESGNTGHFIAQNLVLTAN